MFIGSNVISGNIHDSSLYEIWNESTVFKQIRKDVEFETKCFSCKHFSYCKKGCKGHAFLKSGSFNRIDGRCIDDRLLQV